MKHKLVVVAKRDSEVGGPDVVTLRCINSNCDKYLTVSRRDVWELLTNNGKGLVWAQQHPTQGEYFTKWTKCGGIT